MSEIPTCENCGACCMEMGSPPGYAMLAGPASAFWLDRLPPEDEDRQIFELMPDEIKTELQIFYMSPSSRIDGAPCCWFDQTTRRCRHYEYRPTICREFEPGEEGCHAWRDLYQIQ